MALTGTQMMVNNLLKSLGVDAAVFQKVSTAVLNIAQRIENLDKKADAILKKLETLEGKLNDYTSRDTAGNAARDTASSDAASDNTASIISINSDGRG